MLPSSTSPEAHKGPLHDPPGSTWFRGKKDSKRPQDQMFERAKQHSHNFMAAFDYVANDGRIVKMYASFPSCEDFVRHTLLKTERKHFYELIPEGTPCKLYLDVEWIGPLDPEKAAQVLQHLVNELEAYTQVRNAISQACTATEPLENSSLALLIVCLVIGCACLLLPCRSTIILSLQEMRTAHTLTITGDLHWHAISSCINPKKHI